MDGVKMRSAKSELKGLTYIIYTKREKNKIEKEMGREQHVI
jgi:hypothetical protein